MGYKAALIEKLHEDDLLQHLRNRHRRQDLKPYVDAIVASDKSFEKIIYWFFFIHSDPSYLADLEMKVSSEMITEFCKESPVECMKYFCRRFTTEDIDIAYRLAPATTKMFFKYHEHYKAKYE